MSGDQGPGERTDERDWTARLMAARLDSLSTYHPDGVFSLALDGTFQAVNDEALSLAGGYSSDDVLGRCFTELLVPEDVPKALRQFAGLLERRPSTVEVRFRRPDGTTGELEIIGLPIIVDDEVIEVCCIAEDITERKQFQQMLATARRAAESANEAKATFLATMSHEIRTPLTSVLAAAEMLGESGLTRQQHELVTLLGRSGERLLRLVDEILDFSRLESGGTEIAARPFVLVELVDDSVLALREGCEDKELGFSCTVDPGLPRRLVGDAERIAQVLGNLVDNALKFTPSGRVEICVTGAPAGANTGADGTIAVRFAVADTGIGLSPELQGVVFDRFRQADSSVTREYGGTGLGLATSRQLVTLMGGEIEVASQQGVGSTFSFVLPLRTS